MENKHTQQVDLSNPNADKITSTSTTSIKQETLEETAERLYPISKEGSMWMPSADDCNKANKQEGFIEGAKYQAERMYSEEDMFTFSQWISHEDWVYLPSKDYWVNEEQEELEQKLSSKEILNLWFEQFKKK